VRWPWEGGGFEEVAGGFKFPEEPFFAGVLIVFVFDMYEVESAAGAIVWFDTRGECAAVADGGEHADAGDGGHVGEGLVSWWRIVCGRNSGGREPRGSVGEMVAGFRGVAWVWGKFLGRGRQWEVGRGQWEVGSGKWEVGSGQWEVRSEKWEVRSGKWEVRSGKWEVRSEKWEVRSEKWEVGSEKSLVLWEADGCVQELSCVCDL
jgi:hypothetical protein